MAPHRSAGYASSGMQQGLMEASIYDAWGNMVQGFEPSILPPLGNFGHQGFQINNQPNYDEMYTRLLLSPDPEDVNAPNSPLTVVSALTPSSGISGPDSDSAEYTGRGRSSTPDMVTPVRTLAPGPLHRLPIAIRPAPCPVRTSPRAGGSPPSHALQGLAQSQSTSSRTVMVHPHVLDPPLGTRPHELNPSTSRNEPWSTYYPRWEDQAEVPSSSLRVHFENPQNARERTAHRPAMRDGRLTDEQRVKISAVRSKGACLRCAIYRESCDTNTPCQRCRAKLRKWKLPCVRTWLEDRYSFLEPQLLQDYHGHPHYKKFVCGNTYNFDYSSQPGFWLQLSLFNEIERFHIKQPITVFVKEVESFGPGLTEKSGFVPWMPTEDHIFSSCMNLSSPPIVPFFLHKSKDCDRIRQEVKGWIRRFFEVEELKIHQFPHQYFHGLHLKWAKGIFTLICRYHNDNIKSHVVLRDALIFTFLNYFITKSLIVPEENARQLYQWIQHENFHKNPPAEACSPYAVQMCVKSIIYQWVKEYGQKVLKDLQELMIARKGLGADTDLTFCLAFLILMALGRNQTKIWNQTRLPDNRGEWGEQRALEEMRKMETEVADHIIGLAHYRFEYLQKQKYHRPESPSEDQRSADEYSDRFNLLEKMFETTNKHRKLFPPIQAFQLTPLPFSS